MRPGPLLIVFSCATNLVLGHDAYNRGDAKDSVAFRPALQSFASTLLGGCGALKSKTVKIICTHKLEKITKGIDCTKRVPAGTKATFTCPNNTFNADKHESVTCGVPTKKKWSGKIIKCRSNDMTSTTVSQETTLMLQETTSMSEETSVLEETVVSEETTSLEQTTTNVDITTHSAATTTAATGASTTTTSSNVTTASSAATVANETTATITVTTTAATATTTVAVASTTAATATTTAAAATTTAAAATTTAAGATTTAAAATTTAAAATIMSGALTITSPTNTAAAAITTAAAAITATVAISAETKEIVTTTLTTTIAPATTTSTVDCVYKNVVDIGLVKRCPARSLATAKADCTDTGGILMFPGGILIHNYMVKFMGTEGVMAGSTTAGDLWVGVWYNGTQWVTSTGVVAYPHVYLKWLSNPPRTGNVCAVLSAYNGYVLYEFPTAVCTSYNLPYLCWKKP